MVRFHPGTWAGAVVRFAVVLVPGLAAVGGGAVGIGELFGPGSAGWIVGLGTIGVILVVMSAVSFAAPGPRLVPRDRLRACDPRADDAFTLWTTATPTPGPPETADVLDASLVSYDPDREGVYATHVGNVLPDEFQPLIRLRLRVRPEDGVPFEAAGERRVPVWALSAVVAGRVAAHAVPDAPGDFTVEWKRSVSLVGTRPLRLRLPGGRTADLTGRPRALAALKRITARTGALSLRGGSADVRLADPELVAELTALADRADAEPPQPCDDPPRPWARELLDALPCVAGGFGAAPRRWARRGGRLARARLLELRLTGTYQYQGPVVDTVLRVADGTRAPYDAHRRLTVPLTYLALLHRTKDLVVRVSPNGGTADVDWPRTLLLAGVTPAHVLGGAGGPVTLDGPAEPLWDVMNALAAHGVTVDGAVLDLRRIPPGAADAVRAVLARGGEPLRPVSAPEPSA